jgi:hypothetical protein
MGLFSVIGGLIGAGKQKKASRKAEAAQIAALQKGIDQIGGQLGQTNASLQPYEQIGTSALGPLGALIGVNGLDAQNTAIAGLKEQPLYQSLFRTGEETLLQNAAATGGLRGGDTQRSLADFGSDTLLKALMQQLQGLGGLATLGQGTAVQKGSFGADAASSIAQLFTGQGKARAEGLGFRGGLTAGQFSQGGGFLDSIASAAAGGGGLGGVLKGLF